MGKGMVDTATNLGLQTAQQHYVRWVSNGALAALRTCMLAVDPSGVAQQKGAYQLL